MAQKPKRVRQAPPKTGIFIFCSKEQERVFKEAARRDGRTLSGFALHCMTAFLECAGSPPAGSEFPALAGSEPSDSLATNKR